MSELNDDDRVISWLAKKRENGHYVLSGEELTARINEACKEAYEEGRSDERAVMLEVHASFDEWWKYEGQYGSTHDLRGAFRAGAVAEASGARKSATDSPNIRRVIRVKRLLEEVGHADEIEALDDLKARQAQDKLIHPAA